jgi:hypothetical protein
MYIKWSTKAHLIKFYENSLNSISKCPFSSTLRKVWSSWHEILVTCMYIGMYTSTQRRNRNNSIPMIKLIYLNQKVICWDQCYTQFGLFPPIECKKVYLEIHFWSVFNKRLKFESKYNFFSLQFLGKYISNIITLVPSVRPGTRGPWKALGPDVDEGGRGLEPSTFGWVQVHGHVDDLCAHGPGLLGVVLAAFN